MGSDRADMGCSYQLAKFSGLCLANFTWQNVTSTQRTELLLYLLDLDPALGKTFPLTQRLHYLWNWLTTQSFTPAQQAAWSPYLLSFWWQEIVWEDVEPTRLQAFFDSIIRQLGEAWQPVTPKQRDFWQQWSPHYYPSLLLKSLETVWHNWSWERQQQFFQQLVAVTPLLSNGSFERDNESWKLNQSVFYLNLHDSAYGNPY